MGWRLLSARHLVWGSPPAAMAQDKKIVDRRGCATARGRLRLSARCYAPAMHDYFNLINSEGGIDGYKIEHPEIDMQLQGAACGRSL